MFDDYERIAFELGRTISEQSPDEARRFFTDLLADEPTRLTNRQLRELEVEEVVFQLHALDRIALQFFGKDIRYRFMEVLILRVCTILAERKLTELDAASFENWFMSLFSSRHDEYAKFRLPEGGGKPPGGTLFWEYAEKIYFGKIGTNPVTLDLISWHAAEVFIALTKSLDSLLPSKRE